MKNTIVLDKKQDAALSTVESKDLRSLEQVIERGQKTFLEVGKALLAIKAQKLYRQDFKTFAEYCTDRWGFAKSRAYQMIDAAKVVENVQHVGQIAPPANARQACELAKLPADQQANAWADVVDECAERGEPITAAAVVEVVERYKSQDEPYVEEEEEERSEPEELAFTEPDYFSVGNCLLALRKEANRWVETATDTNKPEIVRILREIAVQIETKAMAKIKWDKPPRDLLEATRLFNKDIRSVIQNFGLHLAMNHISAKLPDGHPLGVAVVSLYAAEKAIQDYLEQPATGSEVRS